MNRSAIPIIKVQPQGKLSSFKSSSEQKEKASKPVPPSDLFFPVTYKRN